MRVEHRADSRVGNATVGAVNGLTARWAAAAAPEGTAFSAAGVWPLLAFLADGATGAARAELAQALGVPAEQAAAAARELLAALEPVSGLDAALGLWTHRTLQLREEWRAGLPAGTHGVFGEDLVTAQERLDAWAAERTGGLVERMPVTLTREARMVLASALTLRTDWRQPFTETMLRPDSGPWQGRSLLGLHRRSVRPDRVGVTSTPDGFVTALTVPGDNGIDVHLVLGEERMTPGQVLTAGVGVVQRALAVTGGGQLPFGHVGPGLHVEQQPALAPEPITLDVRTVAYEVRADHDLLALHALFGLTTAQDDRQGHFPGVSAMPLAAGAARQSALARFGALGFRAAAVTAVVPYGAGGVPQYRYETTVVRVAFDRPFGFLAVDRESRLVLMAGWVTDPAPYPAMGR
ncbi:serpin family protein [Streptomyces diastatochromogenes]|uniref:Proteinase inhibitor I4 serpin n=1 Tax=Streptomyces diastatochromogenes TaxID=42236 RepID=A0A233SRE6_STRDA|nr:serpin family protein [Streptomyces diastatochromogenes]OXY98206.1 proteinase inhibitor I4 serpin [Streptomyces diastatochromogenes]